MTKKARKKLPVGEILRPTIWTVTILAWTALAMYLSNYIVANTMVAVLGYEAIQEPVWQGLMFALVYTLDILLTIVLPPIVVQKLKLGQDSLKNKALHTEKTESVDEDNHTKKAEKTKKILDREALGLKGLPTWADIGLAPVGYIIYFLLAMGIVAIFSNFPWFNAEEQQELVYESTIVGWDRIIAFFSYVVIAPVAEETIFRGWLYGKLRERFSEKMSKWGGMILAIFLVSLVFGLVHSTVIVGVCVFVLSVVLCAFREITGTIYAGILVHMIVNGIAFYRNYIAQM